MLHNLGPEDATSAIGKWLPGHAGSIAGGRLGEAA